MSKNKIREGHLHTTVESADVFVHYHFDEMFEEYIIEKIIYKGVNVIDLIGDVTHQSIIEEIAQKEWKENGN